MEIGRDIVVTFHYRLSDTDGTVLEDSTDGEPMAYLHGHKGIIAGLESAMAGRSAGDSFSVTVAPADAYGERRDNAVMRVPRKHVLTKGRITPGMVVRVNTEHGPREAQVVKAGRFVLDIDTNHPLAGRTLAFDVEVVAVRAATAEELAHGHVHGPGGHAH